MRNGFISLIFLFRRAFLLFAKTFCNLNLNFASDIVKTFRESENVRVHM